MDYKAFFDDVLKWIVQANQTAAKYGMDSEHFWDWVAESTAAVGKKYNDNKLVLKIMVTLIRWLEEVYENHRQAKLGA
jgi:hypothetical protein